MLMLRAHFGNALPDKRVPPGVDLTEFGDCLPIVAQAWRAGVLAVSMPEDNTETDDPNLQDAYYYATLELVLTGIPKEVFPPVSTPPNEHEELVGAM